MATRRIAPPALNPDDVFPPRAAMPVDQSANENTALDFPADDEYEPTAADRVAALLGEFSEDERAQVKLYRKNGKARGGVEWCDDYSPIEFEQGGLKMIREKWGSGEYEIRLYGTCANGRPGVRARELMTVAPQIGAPLHPSQAAPQNAEMMRLIETLAANQAAMMQALSSKPEPVDPMAQMQQMFALMGGMKTALGLDGANKQTPISEIMAAVREMKSVAAEIAPGDDGGDPMMKMLPDLLGLIKTGQQQSAQVVAPVPMIAAPMSMRAPLPRQSPMSEHPTFEPKNPHDTLHRVAQVQQPEPEPMTTTMKLQMAITVLVRMAKSNTPIPAAADYVYDKAPDEIIAFLQQPGWLDSLASAAPQIAPYRAWFEGVGAGVLALIAAEPDDDEPGDDFGSDAPMGDGDAPGA